MPFNLRNSQQENNVHIEPKNGIAEEHQDRTSPQFNEEQAGLGEIFYDWMAPEFEAYEKSKRWYLIFAIFIALMVAYALVSNSPIMAITFILIGIVGYIYLEKDPRIINFSITSKGVTADREMYLYDNINSFWIFYDMPHARTISLHTKASMLPYIHIPIEDEDPVYLRELLMRNIPEIKQDPGLIDAIERVLHI